MTVDTGFSHLVLPFMRLTVVHAVLMFPYITLPPFVLSPLLQAFGRARVRRRLLENPSRGFWKAIWLGVCSPPSRSRNFAEARALLAAGVSPENVVAYLVAAHSFLVYVPLLILALNGPQPVIGLVLATLLTAALSRLLLRAVPAVQWERAREGLRSVHPREERLRGGPIAAVLCAFGGDLYALWWPLLLGITVAAVIAAWGLSDVFFEVPGDEGMAGQGLSAAVGLLLSYVSGVPPVGNVYPAAFLWKAEFFTYAGLMAFYLGVLLTPFALPRYAELFGPDLGWKVVRRMGAALLLSALAVTAVWYALD